MKHCKPVCTPMEPGKKFYEVCDDEDPVNIQGYQKIVLIHLIMFVGLASLVNVALVLVNLVQQV